jgi:site-specific DNA recombinase
LDPSDYRNIRSDCERQVAIIEAKLVDLSERGDNGIGPLLDKALKCVSRLPELYQVADNQTKRHIISSIFPENLTFDGSTSNCASK